MLTHVPMGSHSTDSSESEPNSGLAWFAEECVNNGAPGEPPFPRRPPARLARVAPPAASGGVHRRRRLRDQLDLSDGRPLGGTHSLEAVDVGERREQPAPGERERDRHHPAADDRRHRPHEIRGEP